MYDPKSEEKWNAYWREKDMFRFDRADRTKPLYVIDTPPPNTTGGMHMGQMFWVSYIDSIARYKRLKGFNVLYPQGWDTQGFPVELEVEKRYGKEMPREDFYKRCVDYAKDTIVLMKSQMLRTGASFDESLEYITMSEDYRRKVQLSLIEMYEKGYVYRAAHPVEWCPSCRSSIAREEINETEKDTYFNYIRFEIKGRKGSKEHHIEIATTRPELLHACVAIAVNPEDERYSKYIGKSAITPIYGKEVQIISDSSIDKELGTGAEMVCTFGDKNDISMYYRHKLPMVVAIDESGILKNAGKFTGLDIPEARSAIIKELEAESALIKREEMKHTVKVHDRCSTPIELLSYTQWFLKTKESADKIKDIASSINWIPQNALQRLIDWANFIEWDWNISRNRIFGTPIPFWYCADCGEIIAPKREILPVNPASEQSEIAACKKCGSKNITGEKDVCDVWVDSAITPLVIAGWPDDKEFMKRAFPNSVRIQGTDIVRTWAFYTIFRVSALTGDKPFENLLVHNMILNEEGREMHKSLGTGISPEALIEKYSIDAVRLWVAGSGGIGKDKPFSYSEIEYSKSFISKLYNSAVFVKGALAETRLPKEEPHKSFGVFDFWIINRLNDVTKEAESAYDALNLYEASGKLIDFFWHEFCDYYIENVKYRIREESEAGINSRKAAVYTLNHVLKSVLIMLSPIIPHVAEEINSMFSRDSIFTNEFPKHTERETKADYVINGLVFKSALVDFDYSDAGALLNRIIGEVRKERSKARMALNKEVKRININVPEAYYSVVFSSKKELQSICKSLEISVNKGDELQVNIDLESSVFDGKDAH